MIEEDPLQLPSPNNSFACNYFLHATYFIAIRVSGDNNVSFESFSFVVFILIVLKSIFKVTSIC